MATREPKSENRIRRVDIEGVVVAVDVHDKVFRLRIDDTEPVSVPFLPDDERRVMDAFIYRDRQHFHVKGQGEFSPDGRLLRVTTVSELARPEDDFRDERPILEVLDEIWRDIPPEEWDKIPKDWATNLDHYIYGVPKRTDDSNA